MSSVALAVIVKHNYFQDWVIMIYKLSIIGGDNLPNWCITDERLQLKKQTKCIQLGSVTIFHIWMLSTGNYISCTRKVKNWKKNTMFDA